MVARVSEGQKKRLVCWQSWWPSKARASDERGEPKGLFLFLPLLARAFFQPFLCTSMTPGWTRTTKTPPKTKTLPNVDVRALPSTTRYVNVNVANVLTSQHVWCQPCLRSNPRASVVWVYSTFWSQRTDPAHFNSKQSKKTAGGVRIRLGVEQMRPRRPKP